MLHIWHIEGAKKGLLIHNVGGVGKDKEETNKGNKRKAFILLQDTLALIL